MGTPVDVYFNLHRKVWSIRCRKSGLVTAHARAVVFTMGATMVVRPSGRNRVLKTGTKNVHAFIRGDVTEIAQNVGSWAKFGESMPVATRVTYNPHRAAYFTQTTTGERIDSAVALVMVAPEGKPPQVWAVPE